MATLSWRPCYRLKLAAAKKTAVIVRKQHAMTLVSKRKKCWTSVKCLTLPKLRVKRRDTFLYGRSMAFTKRPRYGKSRNHGARSQSDGLRNLRDLGYAQRRTSTTSG